VSTAPEPRLGERGRWHVSKRRETGSHLLHADNDPVNSGADWQLMLARPCDSVVWWSCNCRLSDSRALDFVCNYISDDACHDWLHGLVVEKKNKKIALLPVWSNISGGFRVSADHG